MLAELRTKSQITIPKNIVISLGLNEGDKLEVVEKNGMILLMPVAVYSKKYVEDLRTELSALKEQIASGNKKVFSNADDLMADLEAD